MSSHVPVDERFVVRLIGSCRRWSSRGTLLHVVSAANFDAFKSRALCGAKPGGASNGWSKTQATPTCERCIARTKPPSFSPNFDERNGLRGD